VTTAEEESEEEHTDNEATYEEAPSPTKKNPQVQTTTPTYEEAPSPTKKNFKKNI
jgi:hypothetical protein